MDNVNRSINLVCPLCGNDMFSSNEDDIVDNADDIIYRCAECKSKYSREELLQANSELIENTESEIIDEVLEGFEKQWKKAMKKWNK